jgi:hypothetical protein
MIQRIQSVWFLIAAICTACMFYFDTYIGTGNTLSNINIGNDFMGITLYTIFLYKNRKRQITYAWFSIIITLGLLAYNYIAIDINKEKLGITQGHYWIGIFLPVVSVVFLFMGMMGIKKDQKIIKSLDRLR